MKIRSATDADRDAIWDIFHEVVAAGETYALDPNISREDALAYWFAPGTHTYVAEQPAIGVAGTYILQPNQSGGGSHVANAGFMVSTSARGQGLGRAMAEHCLSEALRFGFRAMQFNYVISTNTAAIRLWQDLGFEIVGALASAFRHPDKGYVDVYVMYCSLREECSRCSWSDQPGVARTQQNIDLSRSDKARQQAELNHWRFYRLSAGATSKPYSSNSYHAPMNPAPYVRPPR